MPSKKQLFGRIGLAIAKVMVPGIAQIEEAAKVFAAPGSDKKAASLDLVKGGLIAASALTNTEIADPELLDGIGQINDGYVKVMNALARMQAKD